MARRNNPRTMRIFHGTPALYVVAIAIAALLCGCSSEKFLGEGQTVLSSIKVVSSDKEINAKNYDRYIAQHPNSKWFGLVKVPLGIYCVAGKDTSRHHTLHRLGEAPVVYDSAMTQSSLSELRNAMASLGYLHASAEMREQHKAYKTKVEYTLHPGQRYFIDEIKWDIENELFSNIIRKDSAASLLYIGMPCDMNKLSEERDRIVKLLQDNGYFNVNRDFVSFTADTTTLSRNVSLNVRVSYASGARDSIKAYTQYHIGRVNFFYDINEDSVKNGTLGKGTTIDDGNGGVIHTYGHSILRNKTVLRNVYFRSGDIYKQSSIQNTYRRLASLAPGDFASVRLSEADSTRTGKKDELDANIFFNTRDINSVGFEVEGTNMAGDLGVAAALSFENRNVFHGAETFDIKLRGAYEALNGLKGYNNKENYVELSVEANLKMPLLVRPFSHHRRMASVLNSELSVLYNTQDRPEFHRRTLAAGIRYSWNSWQNKMQHRLDLISLNYVFMPWISDKFRHDYLENNTSRNSVLRYSYEDLFIMRSAYNFVFNSKGNSSLRPIDYSSNSYRIRLGVETAGNLFYLFSKLFNGSKNEDGHYKLFNVAFAQYAKLDFDIVKNLVIDERNAIALHADLGLAIPYGNASVVPYEKRYFSGGANSVRGWSVRGLGPGTYSGKDGKVDFINQTGNIKFDANAEYRTFLFWKLHGAVFVDCGNIWTTRDYPDQPGGKFKFDSFWKQLAAAYGVGLRLNLDYFVLRFDGGMKAVTPHYHDTKSHFPIIHPNFSRDFTFHFAVGLPF